MTVTSLAHTDEHDSPLKSALWLVLLTAASVLASFALACATPFAAFGALAALYMRRTEAAALMIVVWLANQVIGYSWLHYPHTLGTYAGGGILLIAALAGLAAASWAVHRTTLARATALRTLGVLLAALIVFQAVVYLADFGWGGHDTDFSAPILAKLAWTNAATLIGLLILHRIAVLIGLVVRPAPSPLRAA